MQQYYEIREDGGRFLPDRYVEGECPNCGAEGARGDQCDECGVTHEAHELKNPKSKMNPEASIEIRDTEHFFYRLDLFQEVLEKHANQRQGVWKPNVKAMTKQWLDMGLRPRAVTRDLDWVFLYRLTEMNGKVSAFTYGLKQSKATTHAQNCGQRDFQILMTMKSGGRFLKMVSLQGICTSLVRTTFPSIQ